MIAAAPQIPSYAQGFAPRDGAPQFVHLREGLVGWWAPFLGPTGETLHNWGAFGDNATLDGDYLNYRATWAVSDRGYVVDTTTELGGADVRYVDCGDHDEFTQTRVTLVACFRFTTVASTWQAIIAKGTYNSGEYTILWNGATGACRFYINGALRASFTQMPVAGPWYSLVATYDKQTARLYLDGIEKGSGSYSASVVNSANPLRLGIAGPYDTQAHYLMAGLYGRVLGLPEITQLYCDPCAIARPRRTIFGLSGTPPAGPTGGPYRVAAGETFHTGAAAGESFITGQAAGQVFQVGQTAGQIHG